MSFENMLTDIVDIYKLKSSQVSGTFGVPGNTSYYYDENPDNSNVKCSIQSSGLRSIISQEDPGTLINETVKAIFKKDVIISVNDKVVFNGVTYKTKVPRSIRGHHIEVEIVRVVE